MTSAPEILPPRESSDRRRSKRILQSSGPTLFSVCACNATTEEKKKKKKGNSWNVERLTKQNKKRFGVHGACTRTMPGPTVSIKIHNLWSTCHAEFGIKITVSACFSSHVPHMKNGAHLVSISRGHWHTDFDSETDNRRTGRGLGVHAADTVFDSNWLYFAFAQFF